MIDPTQRFSGRAENYIKYRPSYPFAIIDLLKQECGLQADSVIADIGTGPGNLARLFLENGNLVYGIEPNQEMREAGQRLLGANTHFISGAGTAEATGLANASVDMVTAGQAFHWFDMARAGREFRRILRPPQWTVLVWNERRTDASAFRDALEQVLQQYGSNYAASRQSHAMDSTKLNTFFAPGSYQLATFANEQRFDFVGLLGRIASASYAPLADQPEYSEMRQRLLEIFETYAQDGTVVFEYETKVYYGHF